MTNLSAKTLDVGTRLAVDRTRLAYERTLMAWVRTATSLISFGFTIYKFFQFEVKDQLTEPGTSHRGARVRLHDDCDGSGGAAAVHARTSPSMRAMRAEFGHVPASTAAVVAALISLLGILAFIAVVLHS